MTQKHTETSMFWRLLRSFLTSILGLLLFFGAALGGVFGGICLLHTAEGYAVSYRAQAIDEKLAAFAKSHPDPGQENAFLYPVSVQMPEDIDGMPIPPPKSLLEKALVAVFPDIPFSHAPEQNFFTLHYIPLKADGSPWQAGDGEGVHQYTLEFFTILKNGDVVRNVSRGSYQSSDFARFYD